MLLGENIAMALSSILANKMRAALTMLGIIIGIGSVIAIRTVGNSVTESFNSSMSTLGATNISVGVTQRGTEAVKGSESGLEFRGRRDRKMPEEKDYITDNMPMGQLVGFHAGLDTMDRWARLLENRREGEWMRDEAFFKKYFA